MFRMSRPKIYASQLIELSSNHPSRIKYSVEGRVKGDQWEYYPDVGYVEFLPELNREIKEFVESYLLCQDLFSACKYAISSELAFSLDIRSYLQGAFPHG